MAKITTVDYCNKHHIPYVLMKIRFVPRDKPITKHGITIINDKKYLEIPFGWTELSYDELMTKYNNKRDLNPLYNGINVNLNKGKLVILDLDGANHQELLDKYGDVWKSKSCNRRLPHLWYKKHKDDNNTTDLKGDIDILYQNVIELKSQKIHNIEEDMKVYEDFDKTTKVYSIKKKSKINNNNINIISYNKMKTESSEPNAEQKAIIDNIAIKYIDNYGDWVKIMWGLYNTFHNIELCDTVSKKSTKYTNKNDVMSYINSDNQHVIGFGTISHYSKISNPEKHDDIFFKHHIEAIMGYGDSDLAKAYLAKKNDNLIKHNGNIYKYSKPYWINEDNLIKDISLVLEDTISTRKFLIDKQAKKLENVETEEAKLKLENLLGTLKSLSKTSGKIKSYTKIVAIKKFVEAFIEEKDYKMNQLKPDYFCYDNCAFDMKTREEVVVFKTDYISNHTGYSYSKSTQKQIDTVNKLLDEIMPAPENRKCLLSVLRAGCIGKQNPYFVLFNGDGSNGKGLLLEMINKVIGNYYCSCNKQFLLEPIKLGGNSALMNLHERRMNVFSEPEEGEQLCQDTIKIITDNPILSGRALYQIKEQEIHLQCISILECNARPKIRGRKDNSILRRIIDLHFSQTFTDDLKAVQELEGHHLINREYKEREFKESHRYAFFDILLNFEEDDIYIPNAVKERGLEYLLGNDELCNWVDKYYDKTDDKNAIVKLKDMYSLLQTTPFFDTLSKKEKRDEWNSSSFKSKLATNIRFRYSYKSRLKLNNINYNSVMVGYKLKDENVLD